ncbi:hypothetical protein FQZ97_874960 [compost metagenome]
MVIGELHGGNAVHGLDGAREHGREIHTIVGGLSGDFDTASGLCNLTDEHPAQTVQHGGTGWRQAIVGHANLQASVPGPGVQVHAHVDATAKRQSPVEHRVHEGVGHRGVHQHLHRLELSAQLDTEHAEFVLALL